jgi:nicotinate phosphoribosyltransferase
MREGKRLTPSPNLEQIRDRARYELSRLPEPCRRLQNPAPYPVHFSCELEALLEDLRHGLTQPAGKKGA